MDYSEVREEIEFEKGKLKRGRDRGTEIEKKLDETNCQVRKSEQLKGKFEV